MHLLHAEKTTIIRKQYAWQGFMSFSILFPAGTSPADCNLPSENNKPMMSLSSQHSNKEFTSFCLRKGKPQHSKISWLHTFAKNYLVLKLREKLMIWITSSVIL